METYEFTLEEIIRDTSATLSQNVYIKAKDSTGFFVAFWGRPKEFFGLPKDMNNIEMIKSSSFPINVRIQCEHSLKADSYLSKGIGIQYSVSEGTKIEVSKVYRNA